MEQVVKKKTSALAIWSFILSFIPLFGFIALIIGIIAKARISDNRERLKGDGFALAGIILGGLNILGTCVFAMLAAVAIPNFLKIRDKAFDSQIRANATLVQTFVEEFFAEKGEYPEDAHALQERIGKTIKNPVTKRDEGVIGPGFSPGSITYYFDDVTGVYTITGCGKTTMSGDEGDGIVISISNDILSAKENRVRKNAEKVEDWVLNYASFHKGSIVYYCDKRGIYTIKGYGETETSGDMGDGVIVKLTNEED